jgi:hypothetical protein
MLAQHIAMQSCSNYLLYCPLKQSASMVVNKQMESTMLVAIGKGIELDVDVTRLNNEVRDFVMQTGLRNLLKDAHAKATAKADPTNYVKRSRELAEKKLANLYAGVTRAVGEPKAPTDPVSTVILRLARKAVASRPEIAAAPKAERLATLNRLAAEYVKANDAALRPRAEKIVALENDEPAPMPAPRPVAVPKKKRAA